jgi:DNA repair exonuclease SbcCD ATPase subunit
MAGAAVTAVVALVTGNYTFFFPGGISGAGLGIFMVFVFITIQARNKALRRLEGLEDQIAKALEDDKKSREYVEGIMERSHSGSTREVEALHDRYEQSVKDLGRLEDEHAEQLALTRIAEETVSDLYEGLEKSFAKAGDDLAGEGDVQAAAMRAISRYQEYRDAKRRASESAEALERRQKELDGLVEQLGALKDEELELSLDVRQTLRENQYPDEQKADTALKALRGYRIRSAQNRQRRGQVAVLEGSLQRIEHQLESEKSSQTAYTDSLELLLKQAGVASIEEFETKAEKARAYAEKWNVRKLLEERLSILLEGRALAELRAEVESFGPLSEETALSAEDLKNRQMSLREEVEAKQKQEHALHISITERNAGSRSLNEVEEERAATEAQVRELEMELQAASYASSMLEEVTRERHSRIAPRLAELASGYLNEITDGAYDELLINREMQISVRIPQTKALNEAPESQLSQGTVDQIYLALRLAMVQCISENGEQIPMLLDDPFANYDDARLARAMKLLRRISSTNQILLFTCRQDVVRAAKKIDAPVVRL